MFRPIAVATLLLLSSVASADQRILLDSNLPSDFVPMTATAPTNNGFWALGTTGGLTTLVRYAANGTPQFLRYPDMQYMLYGQSFSIFPKPDGGFLSTDIENTSAIGNQTCVLRSFDASGTYLWSSSLAQPSRDFAGNCSNVYLDGSGHIWLYPAANYLVELNPDGTPSMQFDRPGQLSTRAAIDPANDAIYVASATGTDSSNALATIWKFTSTGQQWVTSAAVADQGSILHDAAVAADGSVWAFGSKGIDLFGMHVAADGTLLWSQSFNTAENPTDVRVVARADGGASTVHWDTSAIAPEVNTFSSSGSRLWHIPSGFSLSNTQYLGQSNLIAGTNGDVVAAITYSQTGGLYVQQTRIDVSGNVLYLTPPQPSPSRQATFSLNFNPDDSSLTTAGTFDQLTRNGIVLPPPQTSAITLATSLSANAILGPDASAYTLVTNSDRKLLGISAYSNTGVQRWNAAISSSWSNGGVQDFPQLLLRTSDVCVATDLDASEIVQCFALADGAPTANLILGPAPVLGSQRTQAKVTSTGQIVLLYVAADESMHHVLIDASGGLLHNITPLQSGETWGGSGQNAAGDAVIITSGTTLLKLAADGSRAYSVPTDASFSTVTLSNDGTAFLVQASSPPNIERVDASGHRLWQTAMPSGPYSQVRSMRFTASDLYCSVTGTNIIYGGGDPHPEMQGLVAKIALGDGTIQWNKPISYLFGNSPFLVISPDQQDVLLFSGWLSTTQVRDYATSDGTQLGAKFESCGVDQCSVFDAMQAPDGTLRMVHDTTDYVSGSEFQMTIMQKEFDKIFANGFEE